jgi:hypothetical protein
MFVAAQHFKWEVKEAKPVNYRGLVTSSLTAEKNLEESPDNSVLDDMAD